MVRPFVPQDEAQPARAALAIDNVAADEFRLLAAIEREAWDLECLARPTQVAAGAFEDPLGRDATLAGRWFAAGNAHLEHPLRIGLRRGSGGCGLRSVTRVHLMPGLH